MEKCYKGRALKPVKQNPSKKGSMEGGSTNGDLMVKEVVALVEARGTRTATPRKHKIVPPFYRGSLTPKLSQKVQPSTMLVLPLKMVSKKGH